MKKFFSNAFLIIFTSFLMTLFIEPFLKMLQSSNFDFEKILNINVDSFFYMQSFFIENKGIFFVMMIFINL